MNLSLDFPDELLERIAERTAERVIERMGGASSTPTASKWLDTRGAAEYMGCPVSRVHDLVQRRVLVPHRDGRSLRFKRDQLDAASRHANDFTLRWRRRLDDLRARPPRRPRSFR